MRMASGTVAASCAAVAWLALAGMFASVALAEAPVRFTCPDSTVFDMRNDFAIGAFDPRVHRPSAGAVTSADIAAHARLSVMSYEMHAAFTAGADPRSNLAPNLRTFALVYGDPGPDERLGALRLRDTRTFYGVVADDGASGQRFVVLRGTLRPNEWLRNLQAGLRPFIRSQFRRPFPVGTGAWGAGARVHAGFLKIFASLEIVNVTDGSRKPLADALPDLAAGRQITFVGHSLGGALATLAGVEAARLSPLDAPRMRIVTFASPRVGDQGFATLAQSVGQIDRVCNVVDVVPAVPPSTRLTTYVHVGQVFRISSFDWPDLENEQEKPGDRVTCWHNINAYAFMADPAKSAKNLDVCRRSPQPSAHNRLQQSRQRTQPDVREGAASR